MLANFKILMKTLRHEIPANNFLNHAIVCQRNHESLASVLYPNASPLFQMAVNYYAAIKVSEYEAEQFKKEERKRKK